VVASVNFTFLPVQEADRQRLANLIHFEPLVHRHLDWRAPLDWIGYQPFLALEQDKRLISALACPPDPPGVAWIRLFAVASGIAEAESWQSLWPRALNRLAGGSVLSGDFGEPRRTTEAQTGGEPRDPAQFAKVDTFIGAIPLQNWFRNLLEASDFHQVNEVILMTWNNTRHPANGGSSGLSHRPMNIDDLAIIERLDQRSFGPIWHNSKAALELAFRQAALATVVELEGAIVGYQISTAVQRGGHLARLAVDPDFQKRGIGAALLNDLLARFERRGATYVTVNTQKDNLASIALYERFGFRKTGEAYPVYQYFRRPGNGG
jgi:ribosomal-protein-alanine N-acetyltransferase